MEEFNFVEQEVRNHDHAIILKLNDVEKWYLKTLSDFVIRLIQNVATCNRTGNAH